MEAEAIRQTFKSLFKNIEGENHERFAARTAFCLLADQGLVPEIGYYRNALKEAETAEAALNVLKSMFDHVWDVLHLSLFSGECGMPDLSKAVSEVNCIFGMDWTDESPVVLGTAVECAMKRDERRKKGAFYTGEEDIMLILNPLLLDDLEKERSGIISDADAEDRKVRLNALIGKLSEMSFLDPACGCGAFLVKAYEEMRTMESACVQEMLRQGVPSRIRMKNFHGLELMETAAQTAEAALVLAERRMDRKLLTHSADSGRADIRNENALKVEWPAVRFILGNPPFGGNCTTGSGAKEDMRRIFNGKKGVLDFSACWYELASQEIAKKPDTIAAFLSTSSVCQGEQVYLLWKRILDRNQEILFAYRPFNWKSDAAVNCVIVGFGTKDPNRPKYLYDLDG